MSNRLEEIEKEVEKLEAILDEKEKKYWDNYKKKNQNNNDISSLSLGGGFTEYSKLRQPEQSKLSALNREKRLLIIPIFSELSDYGDVISLKKFIQCVNSGGFIDYDGFGRYVKDGKESNIDIYPSDVKNKSIRKDFDTIIWFNR